MMKFIVFLLIFAGRTSFCQTLTPVAEKVLEFSKNNFGKKVERGECWDLAKAALTYANADWSSPFNFGEKINYKKSGFEPGEIIQFAKVKFAYPQGSMSFPQHTAIVYKANQNYVTVYQQNYNNKKRVDTLTLNFAYMKSGVIEVYRPKPK